MNETSNVHLPYSKYERFIKRPLDCFLAFLGIVLLLPLFLLLIVLGTIAMKGNPFFTQFRPGKKERNGKEKIFKLIKFRTMSNEKDRVGNLLSDEKRLNKYGRFLRSTSLDEIPELINIFRGDMAIVGPRPLLTEYLPFYSEKERHRHDVRPGLTGLAQIHGRNATTWEEKFAWDLKYVESISFAEDVRIVFKTVKNVIKRSDILMGEQVAAGRLDDARKNKHEGERV